MATGHLLDTKTVSLNEILGNGKIYRVPQFQRDYSWDQDNWEDLWNDIVLVKTTGNAHYMGSVVLQSTTGKEYLIIDGQQRFTTLSIIILAVIEAIKRLGESGDESEANKERAEILMRQYIGQKDPSSLHYSSKLFLNENNNGFYEHRIMNFLVPISVARLSFSEKLIWSAYQFFREKIAITFTEKNGSSLASFLNDIVGEKMMFIQITVEDELNAYTVFETLNSRGVELTSTDLLKNFLFSLVAKSQTDLTHVKNQWKKIIDAVGLKEFPVFLRYYLMGTRKQLTKEYLFKEIKHFIKTAEDVFNLLDKLESYAYSYVALGNTDDEVWEIDKENRNAISILKALHVTQWKPLAMVAFEKLDSGTFKRLLHAIIAISYRYNVIARLQTNEMEKVYSRAAINLYNSANGNLKQVLADLKPIYVNDEDFKEHFSRKEFNTKNSNDKKIARYTLYKLEEQEDGGAISDFETDNGTIEHILPESFPESWLGEFTIENAGKYIFMLGNLTLLERSKNNKDAADKLFDEKREVYAKSKYALTKNIAAEYAEWTPATIRSRQKQLGRLATTIWKIQY